MGSSQLLIKPLSTNEVGVGQMDKDFPAVTPSVNTGKYFSLAIAIRQKYVSLLAFF